VSAGVIAATLTGVLSWHLGRGSSLTLAVMSSLVFAGWMWPILMYSRGSSQAHHLDEGCFVVMALVLPPAGALLAFIVATVLAQVIRRRDVVKSLFNVGQITVAAAAGLMTTHLLAPPGGRLSAASLGAAVLGGCVFFVVNSVELAAILAANGADGFLGAVLDGLEIRLLVLAGAVALGLVSGLAISQYRVMTPLVILPFVAFRQALAGHFQARHDRSRLLGLFEATLDVHRTMGSAEVTSALSQAASDLLRCPEAEVRDSPPVRKDGAMAVAMSTGASQRWLVASGRSRSEPFDAADHALIEALAALGSGALENSMLYEDRRREEERLVAITSSLGEGVLAFDRDAKMTFANPAAVELLGWSEADLVRQSAETAGDSVLSLTARRSIDQGLAIRDERATFQRHGADAFPVEFTCSPIRSETGEPAGAVLAFRDISARLTTEAQLEYHAFHDALTGLPNRRIFLDRLQQALKRSARSNEVHTVLFVDVDRFKMTNDSLGHLAGDELLRSIGNRLKHLARDEDTLARFGGDEFTLLLENIGSLETAERTAVRILEAIRAPIVLANGRTILASVSIGIALATAGCSPDDVLHDADVAMYEAKARGIGRYETFDAAAMSKRSEEWLDLELGLRRAIELEEISVVYQPVVATTSARIVGAEALVRWDHPELGTLAPEVFIGLAEETGLILPLGRAVLEEACRQAAEWAKAAPNVSIAVNLSARQFQQYDLVREIDSVLSSTGLHPSLLCLEITESVAMDDIERTIRVLNELKELGVQLAIDDFGTGYSSLNYLKRLPVDVVKLDRSFVQELDINSVDSAIVSAVIDLAAAIGMMAIAEGVETADQLARLTSLGCPMVQGYHLARPMSAESFNALLTQQPAGAVATLTAGPPARSLAIA
jgi:diguanylate cyclase (GGDEF)-like protein/PAS domain S-box-containing protein